jgi:hypothetical protein
MDRYTLLCTWTTLTICDSQLSSLIGVQQSLATSRNQVSEKHRGWLDKALMWKYEVGELRQITLTQGQIVVCCVTKHNSAIKHNVFTKKSKHEDTSHRKSGRKLVSDSITAPPSWCHRFLPHEQNIHVVHTNPKLAGMWGSVMLQMGNWKPWVEMDCCELPYYRICSSLKKLWNLLCNKQALMPQSIFLWNENQSFF